MRTLIVILAGLAVSSCQGDDRSEQARNEITEGPELPALNDIQLAKGCFSEGTFVQEEVPEATDEMRNASCEWTMSGKEASCEVERRIVKRAPQVAVRDGEPTVEGMREE